MGILKKLLLPLIPSALTARIPIPLQIHQVGILEIALPPGKMIVFREHTNSGYSGRTAENASAHITIAFAVNFLSAGEILTKKEVLKKKKTYFPVDIKESLEIPDATITSLVKAMNSSLRGSLFDEEISVNIAGNGIYTMSSQYPQKELDDMVYLTLKRCLEHPGLKVKIIQIRTGGQSGIDESGAKAGTRLGIPTLVLAPKGWKWRNALGQDVLGEEKFKSRFL